MIYRQEFILSSDPNVREKYIYDSSNAREGIHKGNVIISSSEVILPPCIRKYHLLKLAKIAVMWKKDIYLTSKNATPDELANKILTEINFPQMIWDVVARI